MISLDKLKKFDIDIYINNFKKYIKQDDLLILFTVFLSGFLNFYFFLNHVVLSPDGLTYGPLYKSGRWEFQLGRPLLAIVDRIRGGLVSPPIIIFFSLFFISVSLMFLRRTFPIKGKISLLIISLLFVLFPSISNLSLFIYCLDGYCLALLFSTVSLYFLKNKRYLLSIIFMIVSLSLYQSFISIIITGVLLLFILSIIEKKESIKTLIIQMITIFLGLLIYYVLLKIGIAIFHLELADYKGASSLGIQTILSLPSSILHAYKNFYSFFVTDDILFNHYYHRQIINYILFGLFFVNLVPNIKRFEVNKIILLMVSLFILPLAVCIMDLIACQTQIDLNIAIGFLMIYLFIIILNEKYTVFPLIKSMSFISLLILCFTYLLSNNGTFQVRVDLFNHFYANSISILTRVKSLDGYNSDLPWMFNNTINYTSPVSKASNDTTCNSLETFYGYLGIKENEIFYQRFLGEKIYVIEEEKYLQIKEKDDYKEMKKGDIKIIDDVIVIKVSDEDF